MQERFGGQKVSAYEKSALAAMEAEETLVHDVRAHLTPAQMVEDKLMALLKSGAAPRESADTEKSAGS